MKISLIAAMADNEVIGNKNDLPWKGEKEYAWDMNNFKRLTMNHDIIMGYNTFLSLNSKPLPSRTNHVIDTKSEHLSSNYSLKKHRSLSDAIKYLRESYLTINKTVYIIGGAKLYKEALETNLVDEVILTVFDKDYEGDVKFPLLELITNYRCNCEAVYENGVIRSFVRKLKY